MIVDFPSLKAKLDKALHSFLRNEYRKRTVFMNYVGARVFHEGDKHSFENVEHTKNQLDMKEYQSGFSLTDEEMSKISIPEIFMKAEQMADDMAAQVEGGVFVELAAQVDEANQLTSGKQTPFYETFLEAIQKLEMDFEDDLREKPKYPTLFCHPDQVNALQEEEMNLSSEEKEQFETRRGQILDKKFSDFLQRESNRKLID